MAIVGGSISSDPASAWAMASAGSHPHAVHQLGVVVGALLTRRRRRRGRTGCRTAAAPRRPASPSGRRSGSRRGRARGRRAGTAPPSTAHRRGRPGASASSTVGGPPSRRRASRTPASSKHSRTAATQKASPPCVDAEARPTRWRRRGRRSTARSPPRRRRRRPGRPGTRTSRRRTAAAAVRRSTNTSMPCGVGVADEHDRGRRAGRHDVSGWGCAHARATLPARPAPIAAGRPT